MVLKSEGHAVGSISLMIGSDSSLGLPDTEGRIGYWIRVPFCGQGLILEAAREIIRYAFRRFAVGKAVVGGILKAIRNRNEYRKSVGLLIITQARIFPGR